MSETERKPTTRRVMMSNAGMAALAAVAAVAIAAPDAPAVEVLPTQHAETPLLAACARFMALQAHVDVINADHENDHTPELGHLLDQERLLLDEMAKLRAVSMVEHRARARVLMARHGVEGFEEGHSELGWCWVAPLFRDLLEEAA